MLTEDDEKILDFTSGQISSTLGHNHPRIVAAIEVGPVRSYHGLLADTNSVTFSMGHKGYGPLVPGRCAIPASYEGKSMAGLIDLVGNGDMPEDSNVLYAHLGDQPALNAYNGAFR